MCREPFIPNSSVKLIAEDLPSDSGGTDEAAFDLLKKLVVSWNLALSERDRIELMMEIEQWLESNGNTHEVLVKTLEMIRAHNNMNHDLEQLNAAQISLKEEAKTVEQSLLSRLKETQLRFTLDLSDNDRDLLAKAFKEDGNKAFKSEEFALSVSLFSRAIEVSSKHDAILYANRAVCYLKMTPQIPHLAIDDCNEAIKQNPIYVKAIHCRGMAYETLQRFDAALDGETMAAFMRLIFD
ncbi:hypothetical protein C0993_001796 [Termitomyces sp. T159_Od127]|nr:hypothetical protein C0993_001796 [Termitomyces sp. T159_Od127]